MHPSSLVEMKKFVTELDPSLPLKIGDVGGMDVNGTYRPLFDRNPWTYSGLDTGPGPNVDLVLDGEYEWKNVQDEMFDVVISGQTLEHVRHPWLFVGSLFRIVKRGGIVCVIAPYLWNYHEHPIDCWRVFPDGMKALLEWAGFEKVRTYMNHGMNPNGYGDTVGIGVRPNVQVL
jgi:SAM-dependent methyltransferase